MAGVQGQELVTTGPTTPGRRHYSVGLSAEVQALAWARREAATAGSVVIVDHEISPRGRLGRLWPHPPERTAVLAMVWRPVLPPEETDLVWAAASLGLLSALEHLVEGDEPRLRWPDEVLDGGGCRLLGAVRAEVQLGPGRVTSAVITGRVDLESIPAQRMEVLDAVEIALAAAAGDLDLDPAGVRSACAERSVLVGRRVIAHLLPRGEVRGVALGVDAKGGLELESSTGLRQRVPIVGLDRLTVVD